MQLFAYDSCMTSNWMIKENTHSQEAAEDEGDGQHGETSSEQDSPLLRGGRQRENSLRDNT